jgi:hypothetical protein
LNARTSIPKDPGSQVTEETSSIASRFSLVIGGPFYRALLRMRLVECPGPNIRGRALGMILLTWALLLVLSLAAGTAFGDKVRIPLLYDYSIYWRIFVGLPLLLVSEIVIDPWIRRVASTFETSGIVREEDLPAYHAVLERIAHLRDSSLVELFLAVVAFFPFFLYTGQEWVSSEVSSWHGSMSGGLSPAGWWFALVSSPVLRFLVLRWLWRYVLWNDFLRSVARLNLNLIPAHPDLLGGLGFVLPAQSHFGILFAALGSVIAGQFANSNAYSGTSFADAEVPMIVFIVLSVLVVLGPLTVLSPKLLETQRRGLAAYGQVARRLTAEFDAKWVTRPDPRESMLGNQDPSSLIDYISSYQVIREMKIIPISKTLVVLVAFQAAAPLAIVWFFATPLDQIVKTLLKMLM